ncbi:tetratricopeptide repeat protein [Tahibacter amnicola]|uniref:Tetratricopeptide repeat protein n=1 Tax=Tahibacter amnicola TaxID=2976241 RepID=A0ABY6BA20_9GAMM|nr:hypothetical protein [Tahibacter amnicola]UXI66397.1 hypothetical protein N4264_16770 [Tahibacter amnicola]
MSVVIAAEARQGRAVLRVAVVAIIAGLIGWRSLQMGMGAAFEHADPALALSWQPDNARAQLRLAERAAGAATPDLPQAEQRARALLLQRPADGRVYRVLGEVAHRRGETAVAQTQLERAIRLLPADIPARIWLADAALLRGQWRSALEHVDVILRLTPVRAKKLFPALRVWLTQPGAPAAFVDVLAGNPPWRTAFLLACAQGDSSVIASTVEVVKGLRKSVFPPTSDELSALVERLIRDQAVEPAYILWRQSLPAPMAPGNAIHNGDFERAPTNTGFDWRIQSLAGASATVTDKRDRAGHALRVHFSNQRVAFTHVSQILLLPPGRFAVMGQVRLDALQSERGLEWVLDCLGTPTRSLGRSEPMRGTTGWQSFQFGVDVPADCKAQRLTLATRARIAAEGQISGTAWFDDLRVITAGDFGNAGQNAGFPAENPASVSSLAPGETQQ